MFSLLSGQGENQGMRIQRLRTIKYSLLGSYDSTEIYNIYAEMNELLKKEIGKPLEENPSRNTAVWIIPEEKIEISLYSGSNDMMIIKYTGDLTFE